MSLNPVTTLAQLQALLNDDARARPAMVMVGSATCLPCQGLNPIVVCASQIESLTRALTQHHILNECSLPCPSS